MEIRAFHANGCESVCSCICAQRELQQGSGPFEVLNTQVAQTKTERIDCFCCLGTLTVEEIKQKKRGECHQLISDVVRMCQSRVQLSVRSICRQTLGWYGWTLSHNYAPNRVTWIPGVYLFKCWPAAGNVPVLKMHMWNYWREITLTVILRSVGGQFSVYIEGFKRSVSALDANLWSLVRCNKSFSFLFCWSISHVCLVCRIGP